VLTHECNSAYISILVSV